MDSLTLSYDLYYTTKNNSIQILFGFFCNTFYQFHFFRTRPQRKHFRICAICQRNIRQLFFSVINIFKKVLKFLIIIQIICMNTNNLTFCAKAIIITRFMQMRRDIIFLKHIFNHPRIICTRRIKIPIWRAMRSQTRHIRTHPEYCHNTLLHS